MAEGVTEQATFPIEMFPNDRLFLGTVTKGMQNHGEPCISTSYHVKNHDNLLMSSGDLVTGMDVQNSIPKEGSMSRAKKEVSSCKDIVTKHCLVARWHLRSHLCKPQYPMLTQWADSSILLTWAKLTLTYTSPGFAYMHILHDHLPDLATWISKTGHTKEGIWNGNQSPPVSMSTKQASLNVLTAKVRSARPWRSRFNLVSQCLTTFHMWWSRISTHCMATFHDGPISSFLEYRPNPCDLMLHTSKYHVFIFLPNWVQLLKRHLRIS